MEHQRSVRTAAAAFLGVPPQYVCEMLRNVWHTSKGQKPLTDREMFVGLSLIARYSLDPIAREVYVTRDKTGRLLTIVGIDGWYKILDKTDHFDGFEQVLGWKDGAEGGALEWVETRIYSKKRAHPAVYRAYAREYAELGGMMREKIPWHMLRLFSLRHAARLFTPLAGVATEEEARWMQRAAEQPRTPQDLAAHIEAALAGHETEQEAPKGNGEEPDPGIDQTAAEASDGTEGAQWEIDSLLYEYTQAIGQCDTELALQKVAEAIRNDRRVPPDQSANLQIVLNARRRELAPASATAPVRRRRHE
jgi:hypothetical protein